MQIIEDPILKLDGITKFYSEGNKKIKACENISFEVKKGEAVSLLGLNGAGKTTLINIISTAVVPTSGVAEVCGFSLDKTLEIKKRLGILHEKNPLYEKMQVMDFLQFVQNMYGIDDKEFIFELCEIWQLDNVKTSFIKNLSKGFKQRVGLVATLSHKPELLILDEPTSGLDAMQQFEFEKQINEILKNKNLTLILCTHDLEQASRLCTRHIMLDCGKIFANGSADTIRKKLLAANAITKNTQPDDKTVLKIAFEFQAELLN